MRLRWCRCLRLPVLLHANNHKNPSKINIKKLYMSQLEKSGIILKQHNSISNIEIENKTKGRALLLLAMKKHLL